MRRALVLCLLLTGCAAQPPLAEDAALQAALGGPQRTPEYVARDAHRHPYETLRFFGLQPGMTVVEVWPGAGWYTEILAPYLKDRGRYYAAHFNPETGSAYFRDSLAAYRAKLAADPARYGQVQLTAFDPPALVEIAPPGSADLVLTFRNAHNWAMRGGGEARLQAAFRAMYVALKPGGVLGVVDHRLPASRPESAQEDSGYLHEAFVIRQAEAVGFRLAARSEINANPRDTADHPKGVWTLPPGLRLGDQDREKYLAIGESDRMTLKFVKPGA